MSASDWQRVQELFKQAFEKPEEERSAFLDSVCGDDAELRADVESLLEHHSQAGEDFMSPARPSDAPTPATRTFDPSNSPAAPKPFPEIEGYEILRELQSGGQGVVYQALQKGTKHKVAIKVLREGPHASDKTRRRFEREIELAASLRHPNIVSILHSGKTATGQQFCVMDYVRGKTMTEYAKSSRPSLEESLRLFATVCDAVNHAHQKGIIHRDLKPNNILVDSNGQPHVLDFGLAKTVGGPDQSLISLTGQVVGTLAYMSPEQTRGNPDEIDTRTDVYALGVIFYELLTGHYPYPVAEELAKVFEHIVRTQPTPPSRVWTPDSGITVRSGKRLRTGHCPIDDEVETIILRSLAKERERRYQSASAIADDVRHYLANEPIDAKRDSGLYVLGKTLRRYRVPIAAGVCAVLLVVAALVRDVAQSRRIATLEQQIANGQQATKSELPTGAPTPAEIESVGTVDESLSRKERIRYLVDQERLIERRRGQTSTLKAYITGGNFEDAIEYLDDQLAEAPDDAYLTAYRGYLWLERYRKSGDPDPGYLESALRDYRQSMALAPAYAAVAHEGIGNAYFLRFKSSREIADYGRAVEAYSEAINVRPEFPRAYSNRGHTHFEAESYVMAAVDYAAAVSVGRERLAESVPDAWRTYGNYGATLRILGQPHGAVDAYETSIDLSDGANPYNIIAFALALGDLGESKAMMAELQRAAQSGSPGSWTSKVARCLSGEIDPADLPMLAENKDHACEAPYYAGEKRLVDGHADAAKDEFQKCVDTCARTSMQNFNEARFARWRLGLKNTSQSNLNEGESEP